MSQTSYCPCLTYRHANIKSDTSHSSIQAKPYRIYILFVWLCQRQCLLEPLSGRLRFVGRLCGRHWVECHILASRSHTMQCQCHYPENTHNRHPIARPGGLWGVCCEFKVWFMFNISHCIAVFNIVLCCLRCKISAGKTASDRPILHVHLSDMTVKFWT